jgi:tetratricopeptide (TPR) repeat protein
MRNDRNEKLLLMLILLVLSMTFEAYAQERKKTTDAPKKVKVEEVVDAKKSVEKATNLLGENPKQALEIANQVAGELNKINRESGLSAQQKTLYEDALLLKARAYTKLADKEMAGKSLRQLLAFNPMFSRPITTSEEANWIESIKNTDMGWLEIATEQPGTIVKIDGRPAATIGAEPVQIPLFPGTYEVSLEKEDYTPKPLLATITAGRVQTFRDISLKREFFSIPIISFEEGVNVYVNEELRGKTIALSKTATKLAPDLRDMITDFLDKENINPNTVSVLMVNKLPLSGEINLYFSKPCFQPENREIQLVEGLVEQLSENPVLLIRSVSLVSLKKKLTTLEIVSDLPDAEVFLNDESIGNTPLKQEVCPGQYQVTILHDTGKFEKKIVVGEDEEITLEATLKPVITFLGILPTDAVPTETVEEARANITNHLKTDLDAVQPEFESLSDLEPALAKESLNIKEFVRHLTTAGGSADYLAKVVANMAVAINTQLLLFGYFNPGETATNTVTLYLFHKSHGRPDVAKVNFKLDEDLKKTVKRIDSPLNAQELLYENWIGVKTVDVLNEEKQTPIVHVQPQSPAEKAGLRPGDIILDVDGTKKDTLEIIKYLSTREPGKIVRLVVKDAKGAEKGLRIPIMAAPVEIPIFNKEAFFNAYLAKLLAHFYAQEGEQEGTLAQFNAALCYMHFKDWPHALEILNEVNFTSTSGISKGTVYYHQARCYDAMGNKAEAVELYRKAATYQASTLRSNDGPAVAPLAQSRLKSLQ